MLTSTTCVQWDCGSDGKWKLESENDSGQLNFVSLNSRLLLVFPAPRASVAFEGGDTRLAK